MWAAKLKSVRSSVDELARISNGISDPFLDMFRDETRPWTEQITQYLQTISTPRSEKKGLTDSEKSMIVETRAALRFGLCCFSVDDDGMRRELQSVAVEGEWHERLTSLLSQRRGDSKCRLYSARLLSNLVTSNHATAHILSSTLAISPPQEQVSTAILHEITDTGGGQHVIEPNWVDMLLSSAMSSNREAMAAIVATIHNCLAAMQGSEVEDIGSTFSDNLASNQMLNNTLLRHFISVTAVQDSLPSDGKKDAGNDDWDSATEWICLLLAKLSRQGLLPSMFSALSAKDGTMLVVPEQNVLLRCMVREAESFLVDSTKEADSRNPFGGEAGEEATNRTYSFLAELLSSLRQSLLPGRESKFDSTNLLLARAAAQSLVDICAVSLGVDNAEAAKLREYLGTSTYLLQLSAKELGLMVDELAKRSVGVKARDLTIPEQEQKWINSLVRLLGNLCYQCRYNQDLLRNTLVPGSPDVGDGGAVDPNRNALHVLLSCTSFATSCFSLREWGVVAIRNALDKNTANQDVVAALDALNPIQSAALDQAGVRVQMDQSGKVSLTPLQEEDEENS